MNNLVFCIDFRRTLINMVHDKLRLKLYDLRGEKLYHPIDNLKSCVTEAVK